MVTEYVTFICETCNLEYGNWNAAHRCELTHEREAA